MQQPKSPMQKISSFFTRCYTQCSDKTQLLNDKLYHDLINAYKDDDNETSLIQTQQNLIQQPELVQKAQSTLLQESQTKQTNESLPIPKEQNNQPQTIPVNTLIQPQINLRSKQPIAEQLQQQPLIQSKQSLKLKHNPRMHKFIKLQKHIQKQKERQLLQKINLQKQLQQKAKQLQELKQKQIKKFELKQKLRKLNLQLDQEKKHLRSKQKDPSFFNEQNEGSASNSRSYMNPQTSHILKHKISTTFIRDTSLLQNSGIKSRSDAQFRLNKLKHKEEMYTPVKHEVAFRLIQKMHAEKLRKHEKIVSEMRRKQEREIEEVKKLEQEKMKERNLKRVRQVLYYTPKQRKTKIVEEQITINSFSKQEVSKMNPQMEKDMKAKQLLRPESKRSSSNAIVSKKYSRQQQPQTTKQMEEQIGLVIPYESASMKQKKQRHQTLYTEEYEKEPFQPMTEEGKEFAQALRQQQEQQQQENYQEPLNKTEVKEEHQNNKPQQIVAENQFM